MTAVVLDAEAVNALVEDRRAESKVRAWLAAANDLGGNVFVPAAVLAELYRTARHEAAVDSMLSRERNGISIVSTDRELARMIGRLLSKAGRGSECHVDAAVVATALIKGGGTVITGDEKDLTAIASGSTISVVTINQ